MKLDTFKRKKSKSGVLPYWNLRSGFESIYTIHHIRTTSDCHVTRLTPELTHQWDTRLHRVLFSTWPSPAVRTESNASQQSELLHTLLPCGCFSWARRQRREAEQALGRTFQQQQSPRFRDPHNSLHGTSQLCRCQCGSTLLGTQ